MKTPLAAYNATWGRQSGGFGNRKVEDVGASGRVLIRGWQHAVCYLRIVQKEKPNDISNLRTTLNVK